jgi:hypothetical protein
MLPSLMSPPTPLPRPHMPGRLAEVAVAVHFARVPPRAPLPRRDRRIWATGGENKMCKGAHGVISRKLEQTRTNQQGISCELGVYSLT